MSNPYNPPNEPTTAPSGPPLTGRRKRPGGLVAVCVIAIVLGGLGVFSSLSFLVNLAFGSQMQSAFTPQTMPGQNNQMLEVQQEMNAKVWSITQKWNVVHWILTAALIVNVALLLTGGIMTLRLNPTGRKLLLAVFISAIVVDIARAVPGVLIGAETFQVMEEYMPRMMDASAPPGQQAPPGVGDAMGTAMQIGGIVAMVFAIGWALAKVVVYLIGAMYLTRPAVKELFT